MSAHRPNFLCVPFSAEYTKMTVEECSVEPAGYDSSVDKSVEIPCKALCEIDLE